MKADRGLMHVAILVRRTGKILGTVFTVVVSLLIVAALAIAIAERRAPGPAPTVVGHEFMTVLSGSMTPTFDTGDVIVDRPVTPAQANDLHVGQIITFRTSYIYNGKPLLITHRIVGVFKVKNRATGQVQRLYVTKGDANNVEDKGTQSAQSIVGVYEFRIPKLGYFASFMRTPIGFGIFVVAPALFLIGSEFVRMWRLLAEEERRKAQAEAAAASQSRQ